MKKLLMLVVAASLTGTMLAGGLVTNTNQSALFTRLQSRNASLSLDAAYYNPAGLTSLGQGLFISVSNQTVGQTRTITSTYPYLSGSPREYSGTVSAPLFPSVYVGYNLGRFAFSAGLTPIGGGGGATYAGGLPSFETMIADLVPLLNSQMIPTSQYSADIFFEGSSVYFGYQVNAAYKINDIISIAAGGRLVTAKNTYMGHLRDISINPNYPAFGADFTGGMVLARDFFTAGATTLTGLATGATAFAGAFQPIIDGGFGGTLLSDGTSVGLTAAQVAQAQQILGAAGLTPAQIGATTIQVAQGTFTAAAPVFTGKATAMSSYAAQTQDIEVDVVQSGSGFTPVFSVNFALAENLNVAFKYEGKTKLELITKLKDNKGGGIFFEGDTVIADMPGMFGAGFEYKPTDNLLLTGSMNVFFDGNVDYDGSRSVNINMIEKNFKEIGFGAQYTVNEKLRASAGWLGTITGVNSNYLNDQRYSANTHTIGGGIGYRINPMIDINLAGSYTIYDLASKEYNHFLGTIPVPVTETYDKGTWIIAVGVDFTFGK